MPTVRPRTTLYLWEFLLQLLDGENECPAISWVNRDKGEFVLKDQGEIAKLWGKVKGRPRMDKIKLGRAMRYYYKKKLLAKVPRRKAVYRFVKFDVLKQTEPQIKHEEFPEIDFSDSNILDLIEDERNEGPLPGLNIDNDSDLPLESLLADKRESVFQNLECQKLFPMETNIFYNRDNSSSNICNRFTDYSNILEGVTDSFYRENTFSDIKNEQFEAEDYLHNSPPHNNVDESYNNNNNNESSLDGSSYFASLLVKSMLIGEEQSMLDQMNPKENYNLSQPTCGYPAHQNVNCESLTTLSDSPVKTETDINHSVTPFGHFKDIDTDTALSALKEFERLIMLNKLIDL